MKGAASVRAVSAFWEPPEREEIGMSTPLSRVGASTIVFAFWSDGTCPTRLDSCYATVVYWLFWVKLETFIGEKLLWKSSMPGLFGEGTNAEGVNDWALIDMKGFDSVVAEASETLALPSLFFFSALASKSVAEPSLAAGYSFTSETFLFWAARVS